MPFRFLGLPSPEQMKTAMERQSMEAEDLRRATYRLLEESTNEHLVTLRRLFQGGVTPEMGEYMAGLIVAQCLWVRKICPVCAGPAHDLTPESCATPDI